MSEQENTPNESAPIEPVSAGWRNTHVYVMAIACLVLGVAIGYFLRGSQSPAQTAAAVPAMQQPAAMPADTSGQPPTLEKMKHMADKAVAPSLEKLKADPNNFAALNEAGKIYRATHQFKEAARYYERALQLDPKNVATRTDLASCLYYTGDVDGAIAQLDKALSYDPKFFGALLNIGIIKIQAKNDRAGAINSWEKILKTDADSQHRQVAKKLIANAKQRSIPDASEAPKS